MSDQKKLKPIALDRREFLKAGMVITTAASCPVALNAMELELGGNDFHQIRTFAPREKKVFLCTMCPYFDGGFTFSEKGDIKKVEGIPDHIATRGKLCSKGLASFFSAADPDRILQPLKRVGKRGDGQWQEISWEDAIAEVAARVDGAISEHGADSVFLNEGGFKDGASVRFMDTIASKSVIRSRFTSISNSAKQSALESAFGVDFLLPDLENTHYVLSFGSNIMETAPPLAQRLTDGIVNNRLKLVTFDVRMSNTAGRSDEWIPVFPGSDGIIALAMSNVILKEGLADSQFIDTWTNYSTEDLTEALSFFTPQMAAEASGVAAETITRIAREFAKTKPATIISQNGVSYHQKGVDSEMACLLLAVVTGNIDNEGGYCLPRRFDIPQPQPAPQLAGSGARRLNHSFPFELKEGKHNVQVLFNHMSNPVYSAPAASMWADTLQDENLVPFIVDFSPFMSETSDYADIILPDVVAVERDDVGSAPTSLLPWVSMTIPSGAHRCSPMDVRVTFKKIIEHIDPNDERGMKAYWAFQNSGEWVKNQIEATDGLRKAYKKLKRKGVWPDYGKIDPNTRQLVNKGIPARPEYGTYLKDGFATPSGKIEISTPTWEENKQLGQVRSSTQPDQFVLVTYKVAFHTLSLTSNLKYLAELWHSNPLWINKQSAAKHGIADGDLVRVSSDAGYLVTRAWLTQGIHPQVVGLSTSVGRSSYGRVSRANPEAETIFAKASQHDDDIDHNLWWRDAGVNPNDIIPISTDADSGVQAWNDTVVTVSAAEPGDEYGDIQVSNDKHMAIYKNMMDSRSEI
ncbi:MAG: molybdopterin-dependent oxidoreductase [Halieaceae bacterium]|jgi:thiosulfate reductase / polysulfide reductase chain A|nr:molybdopterin-dependent oxidoreductase [Halieaceae bacterium]